LTLYHETLTRLLSTSNEHQTHRYRLPDCPEERIHFPFHAQRIASVPISPLRKGGSVEIGMMALEYSCSGEMFGDDSLEQSKFRLATLPSVPSKT
jgi:hypothetical protein